MTQPVHDYRSAITAQLAGRRLIIASNRGPFEHNREEDGSISVKRGSGGLVTALSGISAETDSSWIAAPLTKEDRRIARRPGGGVAVDGELRIRYAEIPPGVYRRYYAQIANPLLWFVFHYMWDLPRTPLIDDRTHRSWDEGYRRANRLFAEAIAKEIARDDGKRPLVLLQDYHLMTCASYLRRLADPQILHFIHVPWPHPDYFRILPAYMRREILQGMLACDRIGFHTGRYATNFAACCAELDECAISRDRRRAEYRGRTTRLGVYPISIEPEQLTAAAHGPEASHWYGFFRDISAEKVIMRIDRLEPSKNILRGFKVFELFLEKYPSYLGRVTFIALIFRSRSELAEYKRYGNSVVRAIGEINRRYGTPSWQPIHYWLDDDYERATAAMRLYDVLLVNPIFDGMNLVAKEGPVVNERDGVLMLSENAGAYLELADASLGINPFDIEASCETLLRALEMEPSEKAFRAQRLQDVIAENNVYKWLYHQLRDSSGRRGRNATPAGWTESGR